MLSLRWALALLLLVYLALSFASPPGLSAEARSWLVGNVAAALMLAILVKHARSHPAERSWTVALALGVGLFIVGGNVYLVNPPADGSSPLASQISFLAVYPFLLAGILMALHQHVRHARLMVGLDGLTGATAGAAVATWLAVPLVDRLWAGGPADLVLLVFVFCDIALITGSLGALAVVGLTRGRNFAVWALGMALFGGGDLVYAGLSVAGNYRAGTWVDVLWLAGLGLIAVGATMQGEVQERRTAPARTLTIVVVAPLAAVLVLTLAPDWHADPLPSMLALVTLAGGSTRFALAFLQVRELAEVREQALTDELTGVGNRRALYERLDELFGPGEDGGTPTSGGFALALVDLDHFKEVNDSLGHATGDELLKAVVSRFAAALEAQGRPHLLTRLGGDEFAVVLEEASTAAQAEAAGLALRESLTEPVTLGRAVLHVRASVGVSLAPDHGASRSDLLFAADSALYVAKTAVDGVCLYSPAEAGDRRNRLAVAEELYRAFERRELTVEYQPIVAPDGRLLATESLVRWDHPERGRLGPGEFLETAERYQLTQLIAQRVLEVALADLSRWRTIDPGLTTSVNISASDLRDESIVAVVAAALLEHRLPPEALTVEVTETAMMRDPATALTVLHALADLGVELSVDDYGTGHSSLAYLLNLPIDEIKLDREFSSNLFEKARSTAIVRSTVELTHALGLRMVAEGVETEQQFAILADLGCDRIQGWHLGRPMPAEALERQWVRRYAEEAPTANGAPPPA